MNKTLDEEIRTILDKVDRDGKTSSTGYSERAFKQIKSLIEREVEKAVIHKNTKKVIKQYAGTLEKLGSE